ncbi:phage scaffolding protein [Helcococcus kunzii]|uniref:phage scaffolding protein n=1 Tax=Helcococcus kunzii TaxID=40091 RepID=UPI0024AD345D|nr:phage scaffolding protein [Helcococcus kunzii]
METIKQLFGDKSLSYAQFISLIKDNGIKLADLSQGQYVDKQKFENKVEEVNNLQSQLNTANETIKDFQNTENDLKTLRQKAAEYEKDNAKWQDKYDNSIKEYALREELMLAGAKNPKAVAAVLDLSKAEFKEGKWVGLEEIINAHKESEDYMYKGNENTTPPRFVKPGNNTNSSLTVSEIMSIQDPEERTKAIMENKNLFEK